MALWDYHYDVLWRGFCLMVAVYYYYVGHSYLCVKLFSPICRFSAIMLVNKFFNAICTIFWFFFYWFHWISDHLAAVRFIFNILLLLLRCIWVDHLGRHHCLIVLKFSHFSLLLPILSVQSSISWISDWNQFFAKLIIHITCFCLTHLAVYKCLLKAPGSFYYLHYLLSNVFCDPPKYVFDLSSKLLCYPFK